MKCKAEHISYEATGFFSKIVTDFVNKAPVLEPFCSFAPDLGGIKKAIEARRNHHTDRNLLVAQLQEQYADIKLTEKQLLGIQQLSRENTFTITTAHQPNIFTGHLYFIYKILHVVKLAEQLSNEFTENNFVPVFYMGSEDADLDELGHIYLFGEKYEWETKQTGAVGRMLVDKALADIIELLSGQLEPYPYGKEIIGLLKDFYKEGNTIEQATFKLVNELFGQYGLIVLLPDNAALKKAFIPVVEKELKEQFSHHLVDETVSLLPREYKVQASGRNLNLFYLKHTARERIEKNSTQYSILNTQYSFTEAEILKELKENPERFSPNVILRPVFQEMILPNIVFIGGGGEIAYWLELKKVFEGVNVPFPVLVLRNSFLIVEKSFSFLVSRLGLTARDLFKSETVLLKELVKRESAVRLSLEDEKQAVREFYRKLKNTVKDVDASLLRHTEALQANALNKMDALEKKMLRAEKKKFEAQQRQLHKLKVKLFPGNSLQERIENFMPYYAKWGKGFVKMIYDNSLGLEQQFVVLKEK